jgi:hypothetical protein
MSSIKFDSKLPQPIYQMQSGIANLSYGIELMAATGLPKQLINFTKQRYHEITGEAYPCPVKDYPEKKINKPRRKTLHTYHEFNGRFINLYQLLFKINLLLDPRNKINKYYKSLPLNNRDMLDLDYQKKPLLNKTRKQLISTFIKNNKIYNRTKIGKKYNKEVKAIFINYKNNVINYSKEYILSKDKLLDEDYILPYIPLFEFYDINLDEVFEQCKLK